MGIIARQSFYNVLSTLFAFALGGLNTVIFYPRILGPEFHGLIGALLANSNIIQPIFSYGIQFTIIKYYSSCHNKRERDNLLIFSILLPLIVILLLAILIYRFDGIKDLIFSDNSPVKDYIFLIFNVAIATAYFEIFYSWLRIQKKTVIGNFLKEVYQRIMITVLLILYLVSWIDFDSFIYALIIGYYLRLLLVLSYALWVYTPQVNWELPSNFKTLLRYCSYIFLTGFSASIILDLDKSMIEQLLNPELVSFYMVAIFIAAVIDTPSRAMNQIISPLVAESLNANNYDRLKELLKKSSLNLLLISGLLFILINVNLDAIYELIESLNNKKGYALGIPIILFISISKLFSASLGCLNNIITNSKYYRYLLFFSISAASLAVFLNFKLIQTYGFIGAAIATLVVVSLFNFLKIILVYFKYNIQPFGVKSLQVLILIAVLFVAFKNIRLEYNPYISIIVKSILVSSIYIALSYFFGLSSEVNRVIKKFFKKVTAS